MATIHRGGAAGVAAVGIAFRAYHADARRWARQASTNAEDADEAVASVFGKLVEAAMAGRGPQVSIRAYLAVSVRHAAYDQTRRRRKMVVDAEPQRRKDALGFAWGQSACVVPLAVTGVADAACAAQGWRSVAAAFRMLPPRSQTALWLVHIDGASHEHVAASLGVERNSLSALLYRAHHDLRAAYLQGLCGRQPGASCAATFGLLGRWLLDILTTPQRTRVDLHLQDCHGCLSRISDIAGSTDHDLISRRAHNSILENHR